MVVEDRSLSARYTNGEDGQAFKVELVRNGPYQTITLSNRPHDGELFDEESTSFLTYAIKNAITEWHKGRS